MANKAKQFLKFIDSLELFQRDAMGQFILIKRIIMFLFGFLTYFRLRVYNKTCIKGTEYLDDLPNKGVLFLPNHQTYFMDVVCLYHIFFSVKWGFRNTINYPIYLIAPPSNLFYVAAFETMRKDGVLPVLLAQAGAILVNRTWRASGEDVQREVDTKAIDNIENTLKEGWVISFPQGTTKPFAPLRKGTAHLIKNVNPIVVPVKIDGFRRAFDKKGLLMKKRGVNLQVEFKEPIRFDPDQDIDSILERISQELAITNNLNELD
ncbi:MAG: 1-acylglycerol-3-phosphate O-acyltransferase [Bacteroidota bacterium]|jgi:1-acyl-sn-glycerol-3-phosphate acyltransferase